MKIAISAGHYPDAPGARSGDFVEHPEAIVWQALLTEQLKRFGYGVVCIDPGELSYKVEQIQADTFDLAVEIHFNALPGNGGEGSETLHYPGSESGQAAARCVQDHLAAVFPPDRGTKPGYYWDDGEKAGPLYFLRAINCTALIIEPEFVTHSNRIETHSQAGCQAIAKGIRDFLEDE